MLFADIVYRVDHRLIRYKGYINFFDGTNSAPAYYGGSYDLVIKQDTDLVHLRLPLAYLNSSVMYNRRDLPIFRLSNSGNLTWIIQESPYDSYVTGNIYIGDIPPLTQLNGNFEAIVQ